MAHEYLTDLKLYIDGERLGSAGRAAHRVINPATGGTLGELPLAPPDDLDRALPTADKAGSRPPASTCKKESMHASSRSSPHAPQSSQSAMVSMPRVKWG